MCGVSVHYGMDYHDTKYSFLKLYDIKCDPVYYSVTGLLLCALCPGGMGAAFDF